MKRGLKKECPPRYQTLDYSGLEADAYVAERDLPRLDALWDAACAALLAGRQGLTPKQIRDVKREVSDVREEAFTFVLNTTGHEKLASQIADDMAMIREAYWHSVTDDPYIIALVQAYAAGRLPRQEDFV